MIYSNTMINDKGNVSTDFITEWESPDICREELCAVFDAFLQMDICTADELHNAIDKAVTSYISSNTN